MLASVMRWGNSLALRLPKNVAAEIGLREKSKIDITVRGREIVIKAVAEELTLEALMARVTPANLHGEIDWGPERGKEQW